MPHQMTHFDLEADLAVRCDRRHDSGPFDIIGDVHGCAGELEALLADWIAAPDFD